MESFVELARYVAAGIAVGFAAVGPAVGIGYTGARAVTAMARQPAASGDTLKLMLIGQAIAETTAIFGLLMAILLLFTTPSSGSHFMQVVRVLSAGIAVGAGAVGPGIGSGIASAFACEGMGRNPLRYGLLLQTMVIGQAVSQTTGVYSLVVAFILVYIV